MSTGGEIRDAGCVSDDADLSEPLYRVVCAAIRHEQTGLIICGARHYDALMRAQILAISEWVVARARGYYACQQGFVNNKGEFMTRDEAWVIAEKAGQLRPHPSMRPGTLHSEDLY